MTLNPGSNLGPYRIIEPVGRGGMASVFKAYEASLDRYVALKVLPPEFLHDPTFAERFRREAQTVARLEHPQIIPIFAYDIDTATGTPWMAMRLISGGSLSQRIKRGRLAPSESARILKDVADALDYAHSAGVIHRDVKPQNVLLDDAGRVYLADFGIAKMVESSAHMTQTGMITGTPQYMAPEQALGKSIDKSIDIYALGIVAYELFTGRVPFSADTPVAVLMKQASEPMPLPPVSEVQEEVTRAILRATAKDPAARWPSALAFAQAVGNATTFVGASAATSVLPAIGQETVAGMTAQSLTVGTKKVGSPGAPVKAEPQVQSTRKAGGGLAVVAVILAVFGTLGLAATYLGYRYWQSMKANEVVANLSAATPLPVASVTAATPEATATIAPLTATVAPTATPLAAETVAPATAAPAEVEPAVDDVREPLTPAERKFLLSRGPMPRKERMALLAAMRRPQHGVPGPGRNPNRPDAAAVNEPTAPVAPLRPARTQINLEVEASQPSTGSQISVLYAQVLIDNRPVRDFAIRFSGGNSFARWKKVIEVGKITAD